MIDEQTGQLEDELISKVVSEVRSSPGELSNLLVLPLRVLPQLEHIGREAVASLISLAIELCAQVEARDLWEQRAVSETPYHRIFAAIENLPSKFHPVVAETIRRVATAAQGSEHLLPIAALCVELHWPWSEVGPEELIPDWNRVAEPLKALHMGIFLYVTRAAGIEARLQIFANCVGEARLFDNCRLLFAPNAYYVSVVESVSYGLMRESDATAYNDSVEQLLRTPFAEVIIQGLVKMDHLARFDVENDRTVLTKHLAHKWGDLRKYLVDYVLITRARPSYLEQEALIKSLRHLSTRGLKPQKFYSALLLKTGPPSVTKEDLGLSAKVFELVQRLAARKTARAPLLKKKPRS